MSKLLLLNKISNYRLVGADFRVNHESIQDKFIYPLSIENRKKFDDIFVKLTGDSTG